MHIVACASVWMICLFHQWTPRVAVYLRWRCQLYGHAYHTLESIKTGALLPKIVAISYNWLFRFDQCPFTEGMLKIVREYDFHSSA